MALPARDKNGRFLSTKAASPSVAKPQKKVTELVNPTAPPAPAPAAEELVNRIALVLDNSGSMRGLRGTALKYANDQIKEIKRQAAVTGQRTDLTVITFGDGARVQRFLAPVQEHTPLRSVEYSADEGSTALNDGVLLGAQQAYGYFSVPRPGQNVSFLVITITDGLENSSREKNLAQILRRFPADLFTFAFLVPPGHTKYLTAAGVEAGNVREWEGTAQGLETANVSTQVALRSYYNNTRAGGQTMTKSFFTDLSGVTTKDLNKLEEVGHKFRKLNVPREVEIREFVEKEFGVFYQQGAAFYELTKPEKIQSHKEVLIENRSSGKIYGGDEAKKLIGIPSGPGVTVKVVPGNHANFRIYVMSTSVNRKLVRGTSVLYRVKP